MSPLPRQPDGQPQQNGNADPLKEETPFESAQPNGSTHPTNKDPLPPPPSLQILFWNVWLLPSPLTDHLSHTRAKQISPLLNAYPVIVLAEAFTNHAALLANTTHPHRYAPPRPCTRLLGSGLLFLSRYPIVARGWEMYRQAGRWTSDAWAAKGIGHVVVRLPRGGGEVQVFGTHMQSGASRGAQVARRGQAEQVGAFVRRERRPGARVVVVCGDLNVCGSEGSVHYRDEGDARRRCEAYEALVRGCGGVECGVEEGREGEYEGDVCRFLVAGEGTGKGKGVVRYVDGSMVAEGGGRLSDTKAMCLELEMGEESEE